MSRVEQREGPASGSTPDRRSPLGIIFLTIFLDLVGFSLIFPLFPAMLQHYLATEDPASIFGILLDVLRRVGGPASDFRTTVLFGGAIGSLFSFLQFVSAPLWGRLSDRIGRRPVLLLTIGGMAASYLLWCFSGNFTLFVASRILSGVMGGNISVATAAMADASSAAGRAKAMGLVGVAFGLGFILGPAIGGLLSAVDLAAWLGPSSPGGVGALGLNPFSAVAAGACLLSVANWVLVIRRFPETRSGTAHTESRTLNVLQLFFRGEAPGVNLTNVVWFLYLLAFSGMEFTLVFLAADRFAYTPRENAYLFVFVGLTMAFVQGGLIRKLVPLYGEKRLVVAGLSIVLPGFVLTGLAPTEGALYLGLGLMAVGSAVLTPTLTALVSLYASTGDQGRTLGLFRSAGALARAIGPLAACLIYWNFSSSGPYLAGAALLVAPVLLATRLPQPGAGDPLS